jgi:pyrimidine-nucleoside phosphorylase
MAVLGGKAADSAEGRTLCEAALKSGKPRELFLANIKSQGGNPDEFLSMRGTYRSPHSETIKAAEDGFILRIDAFKIGHAGIELGVGRNRTGDPVSPTAGIQFHRKSGAVKKGETIMTVWAGNEAGLKAALPRIAEAVEYSPSAPAPKTLILKEITSK